MSLFFPHRGFSDLQEAERANISTASWKLALHAGVLARGAGAAIAANLVVGDLYSFRAEEPSP